MKESKIVKLIETESRIVLEGREKWEIMITR